jgi:opine dehydrogenase
MNDTEAITILGGGNGAFAAAVDLTLKGFCVNLCEPFLNGENIRAFREDRGLDYVGILGSGSVTLNMVTTSVKDALEGTKFVIVICPSTAHATIAKWLTPHLQEGTTVLLNPGHTGGALNFKQALSLAGFQKFIILGETNTLTYVARKADNRTVNITNFNKNVYVAALPAINLDRLVETTYRYYPDLQPQRTIIGTSLRNLNAMMHPPGMVLSAAWIESTAGNFNFYYDAATPAVGYLMKAIDDERLEISKGWGETMEPLIDLLFIQNLTTKEARDSLSLQEAFLQSEPNRWIKAPSSLDHRYMHEDFGNGLVPMVALGKITGVNTPIMESLVNIACLISQRNYWEEGLNANNLGLAGKLKKDVMAFLNKGA